MAENTVTSKNYVEFIRGRRQARQAATLAQCSDIVRGQFLIAREIYPGINGETFILFSKCDIVSSPEFRIELKAHRGGYWGYDQDYNVLAIHPLDA